MAFTVRKAPNAMLFAFVAAFNALVRAIVAKLTTYPHYDITSTQGGDYTAPTSTALTIVPTSTADLAHVITLAEAERDFLLTHLADAVAHKAADATNLAAISYATIPKLTALSTQGDTDALLNALSAALTAHEADTTVHERADATNAITAPDATDLASSKTLAADLRVQALAHNLLAWPSPSLNVVDD